MDNTDSLTAAAQPVRVFAVFVQVLQLAPSARRTTPTGKVRPAALLASMEPVEYALPALSLTAPSAQVLQLALNVIPHTTFCPQRFAVPVTNTCLIHTAGYATMRALPVPRSPAHPAIPVTTTSIMLLAAP